MTLDIFDNIATGYNTIKDFFKGTIEIINMVFDFFPTPFNQVLKIAFVCFTILLVINLVSKVKDLI